MPSKQYSSNNRKEIYNTDFVIYVLYDKTKFNQFLESVEDINSKILSLRLRQLKNSDIIKRQVILEVPFRIEHSLTERKCTHVNFETAKRVFNATLLS